MFASLYSKIFVFLRFARLSHISKGTLLRRRLGAKLGGILALLILDPIEWAKYRWFARGINQNKDIALAFFLSALPHPTTGSGHRFSEWLAGLRLANALGIEYLNAGIGNGWDDVYQTSRFPSLHAFLKNEKFFCIQMPKFASDSDLSEVKRWLLEQKPRCPLVSRILLLAHDGQFFYRLTDDPLTLKSQLGFDNTEKTANRSLRIGVHVRRGDVAAMQQKNAGDWRRRYLPNSWYAARLDEVCQALSQLGIRYHIEIYSEGKLKEFDEDFRKLEFIKYFLNGSAIETFRRMMDADILIVSPSSFSFNAGLLSQGIKIVKAPWWHEIPSASNWISVKEENSPSELIELIKEKTILNLIKI